MPQRRRNTSNLFSQHKHMLIPSSLGAAAAYLLSGVFFLGVVVFAAVWVGNMLGHSSSRR